MKLKQFQGYLLEQKIDFVFFVHSDINITYFTQIKPSFSFLTITSQEADLYLTSLDQKPELKQIGIKQLKKDWKKKLFNLNVRTVGINKGSISVSYLEKLKKIFPQAKFVDVSDQMQQLRALKTVVEIKKIKKACQITDFAFQELVDVLDKGKIKTEKEVSFYLEQKMLEQGAEPAFSTIVAMGKNAATPHHLTSNTKLRRGFLLLDFGAQYQNYCSDMSRVLFLGTYKKVEQEIYQLLLKSQRETIEQIRRNKSFFELDKFVRHKLGMYSSYFIHSLGHGVGLDIHEDPSFKLEKNNLVQKNQIFTIEPGIYFPQKYGLRIEDTLLFDQKPRILTKSSKELLKIKI